MWCALISAKNSYRLTLSTTSNRGFLLNLMSRCFCMISFHVFRLCSVGAYNVYVLSTFLPWWKSVIGAPCLGPLSRIWLCAVLGAILLLLLLDAVEGAGDEEKSNVPEDFFRCNVQRSGKGGRMTPNSSIGIGFCSGASQSVSQSVNSSQPLYSLSFEHSNAPLHSPLWLLQWPDNGQTEWPDTRLNPCLLSFSACLAL